MTDSNTPLGLMTRRGPTVLWNDSATPGELEAAISWGAVGATCNPVIAAYVQGLRDRGKPYKCAIVAAMRKLLIHIQSLMKKAQLSPC